MELMFKFLLCMGPLSAVLLLFEAGSGKLKRFQTWEETSVYQKVIGFGMPFMWAVGVVGMIIVRSV